MSIPAKIPPGTRFFEVLSLVLCGALALAFAIVMPPLQAPDEHGHFVRAYAISRGEFVAKGIPELPAPVASFVMRYPEFLYDKFDAKEIVRDLPARMAIPPAASTALTNSDGHHEYLVSGIIATSIYCPLVYLPASLGIWIARILHASPLVMMYAARVFNVLTFVAALAFSFRLAPGYRALMTAVALIAHDPSSGRRDLRRSGYDCTFLRRVEPGAPLAGTPGHPRLSDSGRAGLCSAGSLEVEHLGAPPSVADSRVGLQAIGGHGSCTLARSQSARWVLC